MKIKIVCDGSYSSPKSGVFLENGERLEGVMSLTYTLEPDFPLGVAVIKLHSVPVELDGIVIKTNISMSGKIQALLQIVQLRFYRFLKRLLSIKGI
jgi:hypothetical protein